MKTFTTYAEKKAKQFLNLLQGYTKGIRFTAILILLLMGVSNMSAATITSDGTARLYFKMDAISWWVVQANEGANFAYFFNSSSNAWSTKAVQYSGQQYYVVIPKGSWTTVILTRNGSQNSPSWNNKFNQTGNITLSNTSNYISKFSENGTSVTWGAAVKPASTGSLSASSTSINIGANVTLTSSLTSNQTINDIKSTSYNISPNSGASISGNTFTATKAGTYTVTATITYNPDGYISLTSEVSPTVTITVNPWTITWDANGGSVSPATSEYDGATAVTLPTPTRTGYNFDGWYTAASGGTKINDIGTTTKPTGNVTYYAHWTPKTYAITLNANGGASNGSATATYNSSSVSIASHPTRTDYRCNGYYTAASGGTLVLNIDGTLAKNVSGYTDANGNWTKDGNATLYAQWTYDVTEYTVTFGVGTGFTSYGSVTAKYNSTSATITSPATVRSGQNITFTATPKPGYVVEGWYTNAACTTGKHNAGNTTYTTSITGNTNVYVKFVEKTWSVAFAASNGGAISPKETQPVGEANGVTIIATPNKGYTFTGWTSSNGGEFDDARAEKTTFYPTAATTVTASFTENKYTIFVESSNKDFGTVSPESESAGIDTKVTITATPKLGYKFVNWTATNGITIADANSTTTTITASAAGTVTANFSIKNYTITYNLNGGTNNTSNPESYTVETETITLQDPTKEGSLFAGWYTTSTFSGTTVTSITKGSTGNLTLYAKWLNASDCIFFYNNLGWSNVFVYFYSSDRYWDDSKGTGSQKEKNFEFKDSEGNVTDANHKPHYREYRGKMTKIEGTNIWYYDRTVHGDITKDNYTTVAFTKDQQYNYEFFYDTEVVRRADFNSNVPMFVSIKENKVTKNNNKTSYYNTGYWMNYPANTGYKLHIFDKDGNKINDQLVDIPFEYGDNTIMPWSVNVSLEGSKTYAFKIQRADDTWYGNNGTMTTNSSGDAGQTAWEFTTGTNNCKITTTAPGTYVFTLKYGKDRNNNYNYLVGVEYPASVGDYRLVYQDNAHPFHPGHLLKKRVNIDTVSFFVHYNENPVIMLQQVTKINANTGAITWGTLKTYALTANQPVGDNPGQAMISGRRNADEVILHIGDAHMDGVDATGIYNFVLEQTDSEATLLNTATKYDGNFYIRTNAAAGGWGSFRQNGNKMTYTSYADNHDFNFNHYFVEWINEGTNVKFTIANDYSYCLSDTLDADDIVTTGNLPKNANVRFGWNSKTNELSRAYIAGSSNVTDRYLVLIGNAQLTDTTGKNFSISGLNAHEAIFADKGNWIYQLDAKAGSGASIQLTAKYNNKVQTFIDTRELLSIEDGNTSKYPVRMVYDFKSNQMLLMLIPVGEVETGADILIERIDQGGATQVQSTIDANTDEGYTVYATMTFTKEHLEDDKKTNSEKLFYWVSFPFNVRISDVSGFGEYGKHWIIQYYDGEKRAKEGCWIDSPTFWTFVTDTTGNNWNNGVLEANRGYILVLANNINSMGLFTNNNTSVSLYFPSREKIKTIGQGIIETSVNLAPYTCTIKRDNRDIYDSNWHMIGVPSYSDKQQTLTQDSLLYYYAFDPTKTNPYTVTYTRGSKVDFKSMHSYLVQFAGTINWRATWQLTEPQGLAARRDTDSETDFRSLRLELQHNGEYADQTFVQMQSEQATAEYDMNIDLTKFINPGANIYTLTSDEHIQLAGNVLPLAQTTIALGVVTTTDGEYTFTMPEGTDGMMVELIDYVENTTTNLLFNDYIVNLPAGTYENRFALHVQPSKVVTDVDNMLDAEHGTKKYIINGQLIIQTSEGIFNAQGTRL